jgi:hypothetical protein
MDEVLDRQSRPTQRRIIENAEGRKPKRFGQMFMKREAYQKPADPRPITQINGPDKVAYSRFMYAFEKVMKKHKWYAFGQSPIHVSQRIVEFAMHAQSISASDFRRFDGHGSNAMRDLEQIVLLRAFRGEYHEELLDLMRAQYNFKSYTKHGVKYNSGFARSSGSPETSLFNSFVNAFVAFCAFRMMKVNGRFLSPIEAFSRLGVYGGDDGLTPDIDSGCYAKAAKMIGQELAIGVYKRGEPGVNFLARIYGPGLWSGDCNSMCDIARTLSKFHVTVNLPSNVTPLEKLAEKTRAFMQSDRNTPIIGPYITAVSKVLELKLNEKTRAMRPFCDEPDPDVQYQNDSAEWMVDMCVKAIPDFDEKSFLEWVNKTKTPEGFLAPPLCAMPVAPTTPTKVVVNGEIVFPERKSDLPVLLDCECCKAKDKKEHKGLAPQVLPEVRPQATPRDAGMTVSVEADLSQPWRAKWKPKRAPTTNWRAR